MREWESLSHVQWECKCHVVIIPKYRRCGHSSICDKPSEDDHIFDGKERNKRQLVVGHTSGCFSGPPAVQSDHSGHPTHRKAGQPFASGEGTTCTTFSCPAVPQAAPKRVARDAAKRTRCDQRESLH
jgi:hypothetical protein